MLRRRKSPFRALALPPINPSSFHDQRHSCSRSPGLRHGLSRLADVHGRQGPGRSRRLGCRVAAQERLSTTRPPGSARGAPPAEPARRYTTDSQLLRRVAQQRGWETLRLDGQQVPQWFDPPDEQIALFYTAPHAFEIAAQMSRTLLGCSPDWTVRLPAEFLHREVRQTTLGEALRLPGKSFIKHAVSKAFPAAIYDSQSLAMATSHVPPSAMVHVGEPVEWLVEYRCFILNREIAALCPYRRHGEALKNHSDSLGATPSETNAARECAESLLESSAIDCPPAFVLDVGLIKGRGWAVVEFNECWASGIYSCDPVRVLDTLLRACVPSETMTSDERRWDFKQHYLSACSLS